MDKKQKVIVPEIIIEGNCKKMFPEKISNRPRPPVVPQKSYEDSNMISSYFHRLRHKRMLENAKNFSDITQEQNRAVLSDIQVSTQMTTLFNLQQQGRIMSVEAQKAEFELDMMRKDARDERSD